LARHVGERSVVLQTAPVGDWIQMYGNQDMSDAMFLPSPMIGVRHKACPERNGSFPSIRPATPSNWKKTPLALVGETW
jgi:hypothetical protein